jgi:hypothetical protein
VDYPKGDVKAQVKHTARTLLECYNCHSLAEYGTLLNLYNVTVYEVRGSVDGKEYHGIMYGALDDNGQQVGTPFKSSKFGKAFGYEALQKKFAASTEKVKKNNLAERTRQEVIKAMQDIGTKEDFARKLKEADIETVYRINPEGRLYGITFIDHTTRTVFNGSRLGKAFSANVFNELFNNPDAAIHHNAGPLVFHRQFGDLVAHQRAAQRAAAVHHQHAAGTRLGQGVAHQRIVFKQFQRDHLAAELHLAAKLLEHRRHHAQMVAVGIAQVGGLKAHDSSFVV